MPPPPHLIASGCFPDPGRSCGTRRAQGLRAGAAAACQGEVPDPPLRIPPPPDDPCWSGACCRSSRSPCDGCRALRSCSSSHAGGWRRTRTWRLPGSRCCARRKSNGPEAVRHGGTQSVDMTKRNMRQQEKHEQRRAHAGKTAAIPHRSREHCTLFFTACWDGRRLRGRWLPLLFRAPSAGMVGRHHVFFKLIWRVLQHLQWVPFVVFVVLLLVLHGEGRLHGQEPRTTPLPVAPSSAPPAAWLRFEQPNFAAGGVARADLQLLIDRLRTQRGDVAAVEQDRALEIVEKLHLASVPELCLALVAVLALLQESGAPTHHSNKLTR
jgi:hypothetical protein